MTESVATGQTAVPPQAPATDDTAETAVEGVDLRALSAYLDRVVPESGPAASRTVQLMQGGRSNLTYLIRGSGRELVLRRPPLGDLLPTAHDMRREYQVQHALARVGFPVAGPVAFCDDKSITGTDFYLMPFVEGLVIDNVPDIPELAPEVARTLSLRLMDTLADLHAVNFTAAGLSDFGRPDGYLQRQVTRWTSQWIKSRTRAIPELDELARRLRRAIPREQPSPSIVHGDFRLGNMILGPGPAYEVGAVLDWELSTLGDPMADLGFTLAHWREDGGPLLAGDPSYVVPQVGFLSRLQMADEYARASGRDVTPIDYYAVLACFKTAVIFEGIHARHLSNDTVGDYFDDAGERVNLFIERAFYIASRSSLPHLKD